MIFRLVAISLCLQTTWACVPVKPAEDMPCPSLAAIQAGAAPGYATSPLQASTVNGAKVYKCTAPEKLLSVEGGTVKELADGATIRCQPNSALFTTDDGKAVGNKKFVCGEVLVPCPALPEHTGAAPTDVTKIPMIMSMSNGDTTWQCGAAPASMYNLANGDPTMQTKLAAGVQIKCKRQSGKLTLVDGTTETDIDPTSTDKYMCGKLTCQLCDMSKIVDKTVASCATQPDIFCTNKPVVTANAAGCPVLECDPAEQMYLIDAVNSKAVTGANIKCDGTNWLDGTTAIPANSVGFVCGKPATCINCNGKTMMAYGGTALFDSQIKNNVVAAKPTCTYKCPTGFQLKVNNVKHTAAVCTMDTEVVTVDTTGGAMLSDTNKFICEECKCMQSQLTDGQGGLCSKGKVCAVPAAGNPCTSTCPGNSKPIYWDSNKMLKTSPTITCEGGTNWIEPGIDTIVGVTCEFPAGSGYTTAPPAGSKACPTPTAIPCATCTPENLVYVPSGTGYYLTCLKGSLTTEKATGLTTTCSELGTWNEDIKFANCVNPTDPAQVSDCLNSMTDPSVMGNVNFECELGKCYLSCKGANQQFQYETDAVHTNKYLLCHEFEVYPLDLAYIADASMIKCI